MNKAQYKSYRRALRVFQKNLVKLPLSIAISKSLLIASRQYFENDTVAQTKDHPNDKDWKEIIIPKTKESKEEFESKKALYIVQVWIDCALNTIKLFSGNLPN
jgi:hypothetical protein